jgi:hypothetical protein
MEFILLKVKIKQSSTRHVGAWGERRDSVISGQQFNIEGEISVSHGGEYEDDSVLGYGAVYDNHRYEYRGSTHL